MQAEALAPGAVDPLAEVAAVARSANLPRTLALDK
jgi:hypothetical protein